MTMTTTDQAEVPIDMSQFLTCSDEKVRDMTADMARRDAEAKAKLERKRKAMAPGGSLGLPPALEAARWEHLIPDAVFTFSQPTFDRVLVYQIKQFTTGTYGDSGLVLMTDEHADRDKNMCPRGVLISAGLQAYDYLYSHGIEIGDVINFVKYTQYRLRVGTFEGEDIYAMPLRVHELYGSETLLRRMRSGEMSTLRGANGIHFLGRNNTDEPTVPALNPFTTEG